MVGTFQPKLDAEIEPQNQEWDAIAIIEELSFFDESLCEGTDPQLIDTSSTFGKNFFLKEFKTSSGELKLVKNYFVNEIQKTARYMIPFARNVRLLLK
jgi:hypothetical protein